MTWNEFKKYIDKELGGKNPKIFYIDTISFPESKLLDVFISDKGLIIS